MIYAVIDVAVFVTDHIIYWLCSDVYTCQLRRLWLSLIRVSVELLLISLLCGCLWIIQWSSMGQVNNESPVCWRLSPKML